MGIYALLDSNGLIVNRIELDNLVNWAVPESHTLIIDQNYDIGGQIINGVYKAPAHAGPFPIPLPQTVLSQDLMAQFTVADYSAIKAAVAANDSFGLLWSAMQAQKDPMIVTNARFKQGWSALIQILGQARMDAIAKALGVTVILP